MSNLRITSFLVLCTLVFQTHSLTIINNGTISSNFLKDEFFRKFRLGFNLSEINGVDMTNARNCILQLQEIVNQFPSGKVLPFIDSWGRFPSGLLFGHLRDLGNYDQCVTTSIELNETVGTATGKYCTASLPLTSSNNFAENDLTFLRETPLDNKADLQGFNKLKIGVCIPATCNPDLISLIFKQVISNTLNGTFSDVKVSGCSVNKKPEYEPLDIFAIVLFSIFGGLMILSTIYDFFTNYFEKKSILLLKAFSVISNGRKLFRIDTKRSRNSIDCLTGIRVLSMVWVLHCHNYMFYATQNLTNPIDILRWYKKPWSMTVLMATVSVDSFFLLSGILVAWLGLKQLDKTKGKLDIKMMYIHRYIRLTPPLAALILFYVTLNKFIGSGPMRENTIKIHDSCKQNWWVTLLYLQNYVHPNKICVIQSWYLAIDTQLYLLSPLILIPLWKLGKKVVPILMLLSLLSIGCTWATFFTRSYTSLVGFSEPDRTKRIYFPTHIRYPAWLVGVCVGYFMHLNKQKSLTPSRVIQVVGWVVCFGTLLSIIFGPYFAINSTQPVSVSHAAAYESLKRVSWSIALSWIVVACYFGFGGIVNSILSHTFWQPLGRLTYCMYLIHLAVQSIDFGTVRTDAYFSDYRLYLHFWSTFGISVLVAIVLSLSFEAPILAIEKVVFGKTDHKESLSNVFPSAPNKVSIDGVDSKAI